MKEISFIVKNLNRAERLNSDKLKEVEYMKKTYIVTASFDNNKDVEIFEYNGLTKKEA